MTAEAHIAPVPRISIQAFCETAGVARTIEAASADRRMNKAHVKVNMGGGAAALEAYRSAPTPNLIVIETDGERDTLIPQLDELAEFCDAGTKVVIIGAMNDIPLYRELMARGVSDYLVAPLDVLELIAAISALYAAGASAPLGRVVAVTGAKGGSGSSTIAHNIAWSVATEQEIQTILVDLDLGFGTAGLDFNQDPPQGVAEAVYAPDRLDQNMVDRLLSRCSDNLSLLGAPATLERCYDFSETTFDALLDILRQSAPIIVLDVPNAWNGWARRLLVGADEVMIVAEPDLANLRNAKNMLDQLRTARPNDNPARLILNKVGVLKRPEIGPGDFAKSVETSAAAVIPFDARLFGTASNNGQMIVEVEASSKIAEIFSDLARVASGRIDHRKAAKKTLFEPLLARFARKKA